MLNQLPAACIFAASILKVNIMIIPEFGVKTESWICCSHLGK